MIRLSDNVKGRLEKIASYYEMSLGKTVGMLVDSYVFSEERLEYFVDGVGRVSRISGLDGKTTTAWKVFVERSGPIELSKVYPTVAQWDAFLVGRDG